MTKRTLSSKVTKLKQLKTEVSALEEQIAGIGAQIRLELNNNEEMKVGIFTIQLKAITQNRFDSKAFKDRSWNCISSL